MPHLWIHYLPALPFLCLATAVIVNQGLSRRRDLKQKLEGRGH